MPEPRQEAAPWPLTEKKYTQKKQKIYKLIKSGFGFGFLRFRVEFNTAGFAN